MKTLVRQPPAVDDRTPVVSLCWDGVKAHYYVDDQLVTREVYLDVLATLGVGAHE